MTRQAHAWRWGCGLYFFAALSVAGLFVASYGGPFRKPLVFGLAVLLLVPAMILKAVCPLPFEISISRSTVTYEFASREIADKFATLNQATIVGAE